jgi:hypothetical protein
MLQLGPIHKTQEFGPSEVWEPLVENKGCQRDIRFEFPRILNIHYNLDPGKTFLGAYVTS